MWTDEDESKLLLLGRLSPVAAMHVREALRQAYKQRAQARVEYRRYQQMVADDRLLLSLGIWPY